MLPAPSTDPAGAVARLSVTDDWQALGLCTEIDPELWFPERGENVRPAKRVCAECPVQAVCLEYALTFDAVGIWGGTSEKERRRILRERCADPKQVVVAVLERTVCGRGLHSADLMRTGPDGRRWCKACKRDDRRRYNERHGIGQAAA